MQEAEYGPDPEDIRVFDFSNETLRDLEDAVKVHDFINSGRYYMQAKEHLEEAARNARQKDKLLGLKQNLLSDIHDVLFEVANIRIEGHKFSCREFDSLEGDFNRQMERAETAAEVGPEHVATEEY